MEDRLARNGSLDVEGVHHFRAGQNGINDVTISIRNSPPLTYENMHQNVNEVDRSTPCNPYDLAPNRQTGSLSLSAPKKTPMLPLSGRIRPLPIPIQPKVMAGGRAVILSQSNAPIVSIITNRPPPALHNPRRRPLPQPGFVTMSAAPSTLAPIQPSSQSSSLLSSSYASHSRSESSTSNAPSLCTASSYNYLPHSSSSYQSSFSSASRASTLPIATMQHSHDQIGQNTLALPRRAETQPNSAPPYTAGFIIDTAMAPRNMNPVEMAPVKNVKARSDLGTGDQAAPQAGGGLDPTDIMAVRTTENLNAVSVVEIVGTKPTVPSLPPFDFGLQMSPIAPFLEFKHKPSPTGDHTTNDDQITEENELGLSGMRREQIPQFNSMQTPLQADIQPPPPPAISPPTPPPSHGLLTTQARGSVPLSTPVSLQPLRIANVGTVSGPRKNRPALTIRTWDLDVREQPKKEKRRTARAAPSLPVNQAGNQLTAPSMPDKSQTQRTVRPNAGTPRRMHQDTHVNSRTSFLPSMGATSRQSAVANNGASALVVPIWGDSTMAKNAPSLGPGMASHPEHPSSTLGGGLAAQLRKMKVLHRKSRSVTEWTWSGTLNVADSTLRGRSGNTPSVFPSASITPSRGGLFGARDPYGYQHGAAACSMTSVGVSMPAVGAVPSITPRPDTIHLTTAIAYSPSSFQRAPQFMNSQAFQSAPRPPTPAFAESKKSIGALWTRLRFGTARKTTEPNSSKRGAVDLW